MEILTHSINVTQAKDLLFFDHIKDQGYAAIWQGYQGFMEEKFEIFKQQLKETNTELYDQVNSKLYDLSGTGFHSSLLFPEVAHLLLNYKDAGLASQFVIKTLDAERAKIKGAFDTRLYPYLWTSNGDYLIHFDQDSKEFIEYESPKLSDRIPLDFFSPYSLKITTEEMDDPDSMLSEYPYENIPHIYDCLEQSILPLQSGKDDALELILTFTSALIIRKQIFNSDKDFSISGSHPDFIGRVLLTNPEVVSPEVIIDSLVHEATHSLLYIIDEINRWMPSPELSFKIGNKAQSSWSGRFLTVRTYLHAVFVWYGLFNFWNNALNKGIYDAKYAEERAAMIKNGFKNVNVEKLNEELILNLPKSLLDTYAEIKEYVLSKK